MTRGFWSHPLVQLTLVRLREFYREPEAVFWVHLFPLLMILGLGLAFNSKKEQQVRVDIVRLSSTEFEASKQPADPPSTAQQKDASPEQAKGDNGATTKTEKTASNAIYRGVPDDQTIIRNLVSEEEARRRLRVTKTDLVILPPDPVSKETRFLYDPTRPESLLAREKVNHALQVAAGRADPIKTRDEIFKEEGGRYIDFLVPGLIGMGLMGGGMWGVGFTIVDMRIKKLLKRFLATPMNRMHFLIAAMISRVIILIPELCIQLAFAYFIFGVRNHGSWLLFVGLIIVGELVFSSIGLLVASRAKTIDAISGLMNLTMLPMWILSGVFFSSDNYPQALQPLIKILPLTAVNNALRAVMQDGYGIGQIWYELTVMAVWTVICLPIALRIFRWQ